MAGVLAAILLLGVLAVAGIFMAGMYFADNIHVEKTHNGKSETVRVETPIGTMQVKAHKKLDPKLIGVPVYPGAVREDDNGAASFEFSSDFNRKEFTVLAAKYSTGDSVDKVREFYHHELPHWIITQKRNTAMKMEYTEDGYKRIIAIYEEDGRTRIGLASIGEPASN